jgi:peroxiredoxin
LQFALLVFLASAQSAKQGGSKANDVEGLLPSDARHLNIGDPAPDFSLNGVDGKIYTLADFKEARVLMVVFLSNHCPYSHAAETRLLPMVAEMKPRGLAVVAINPNNPEAVNIDELGYAKYSDSYDEMKVYAREQGFTFPYLYDGGTQATAKAYGCLCTPHVFIFDAARRLRYNGRFDDSRFADPGTVHSPDTRNALEALLAGGAVPVEATRPIGCSTKWLEKKPEILRSTQQWESKPVVVEPLDVAGVKALARNETKKLRLINVWATWCVPCVQEFPDLVSVSRRLASRDFEMISISVDDPKDEAGVKLFLEKQHAAVPGRVQRSLQAEGRRTNSYLFAGANLDALMQALDPAAPGPVPYTVVIAPGGEIVYRHSGVVDARDLLAKIIDKLSPYYTPGVD